MNIAGNKNEGLTRKEILDKIKHLSKSVHVSILKTGTDNFCKNRMSRIKILESYL